MGKILVFGSCAVDLIARTPHLPVTGETVIGTEFDTAPGGKGFNQGVSAHKSGAETVMATKMGNDSFGKILLDFMKNINMKTDNVIVTDNNKTGIALIMVDEKTSHNKIVIVPDACKNITDDEVINFSKELDNSDYLLTQLETNMSSVNLMCEKAYEKGVKIILNPAPVSPISDDIMKKISIITPNEVEAETLTGVKVSDEASAEKAADVLLSKGVDTVIITLGEKGAFVKNKDEKFTVNAVNVKAVDTTGAGDAFNGALAAALSDGLSLRKAVIFANAVSGLSVTKHGAAVSVPDREEVINLLKEIYTEK